MYDFLYLVNSSWMPNSLRRASYWRQAKETSALVDYQLLHEAKLPFRIKLRYISDQHNIFLLKSHEKELAMPNFAKLLLPLHQPSSKHYFTKA